MRDKAKAEREAARKIEELKIPENSEVSKVKLGGEIHLTKEHGIIYKYCRKRKVFRRNRRNQSKSLKEWKAETQEITTRGTILYSLGCTERKIEAGGKTVMARADAALSSKSRTLRMRSMFMFALYFFSLLFSAINYSTFF